MKRIEPIEQGIDNKFSMLNKGISVHSKIKDVVSKDFVLSVLTEQEKEGMIELTSDARYATRIILSHLNETIHEWDYKKKCWVERPLNKEEEQRIREAAQHTFDTYMNRLMMINIVNRNRGDNPMLKYMFEIQEEEIRQAEEEQKSLAKKFTGMFKKEKEQ